VLTGDFKVVLAGEWHWQGEGDDLATVDYAGMYSNFN
jgi:hypothetical protein